MGKLVWILETLSRNDKSEDCFFELRNVLAVLDPGDALLAMSLDGD